MPCYILWFKRSVSLFPLRIRPSMGCGPFRIYPSMWQIVPKFFSSLSNITQEFLFFIGSQAFSIPLFALSWWVKQWVIHNTVYKPKYIEYTLYCTCILYGASPSILCFMMYNYGFFLPDSVVMCYFIALASVYGKSVAQLRAQLKLVSCLHLPFWFKVIVWFPNLSLAIYIHIYR